MRTFAALLTSLLLTSACLGDELPEPERVGDRSEDCEAVEYDPDTFDPEAPPMTWSCFVDGELWCTYHRRWGETCDWFADEIGCDPHDVFMTPSHECPNVLRK